jgi:16S rRNA (guanine527-N7)-methyltransferase
VVWARAEELNKDNKYKGKYAIALARAVAKLDKLISYALPFLKQGGLFIAQKGPEIDDEIRAAAKSLKKFSGCLKEVKFLKLSNGDPRSLILIQKF